MSHRLPKAIRCLLPIGVLASCAPTQAAEPRVIRGDTFAEISVTVNPDQSGTVQVPSPFVVIPGSRSVAIHVPESDGIFLLEGDRILHHFSYITQGENEIHDLEATKELLVAGRHRESGKVTVVLDVYDLTRGVAVGRVETSNPYLRVGFEEAHLWRAVVEGSRVGVYQPTAGASYPLWERDSGQVASADQIAWARSGIGFSADVAWVPNPDGSVSRTTRGATELVTDVHGGEFLDPVSNEAVLLLQPSPTVRSDADGQVLLPRNHRIRLAHDSGEYADLELRALAREVSASRVVIHGRPVRVREGRLYWIFLGFDYLEIRSAPLPTLDEGHAGGIRRE